MKGFILRTELWAALPIFMTAASGAFAEEWQISFAGAVAGKETVIQTSSGFSGEGGFLIRGIQVSTKYEVSLDPAGKLAGYTATVNAAGTAAQITAMVSNGKINVRAEQGGKLAGEKSFPLTDSTVILDNNIASHFRQLSAFLSPTLQGPVTLQLLVPQALVLIPLQATLQKTVYHWKSGDKEGTALMWQVTSPLIAFGAYQDAASGAILSVELPAAQAVYALSGYSFTEDETRAERPAYFDPSEVAEQELTIKTGAFSMGATLATPRGARGPLPGVLLVPGSGPNDRDETIGNRKPFRDIAFGLAAKGFAVLRFDKRTFAYRGKPELLSAATITVEEEFVDDAVSAFRLLSSQKIVDPNRMTVIGHSLGAWGLPFIYKDLGADSSRVRHLVFLAPAANNFPAMLLRQIRFQLSLAPDSEQAKAAVSELERQIDLFKSKGTVTAPILGAPAAYWQDIFTRDPVLSAKDITADMLFVRGSKDIQVADEDFRIWQKAIGGKSNASFVTLSDLNHIFQAVQGQSTGAEYFIDGYVDPRLIELLAGRTSK
jgi:pimeloyl-ACP methyl ester carboxylesterase